MKRKTDNTFEHSKHGIDSKNTKEVSQAFEDNIKVEAERINTRRTEEGRQKEAEEEAAAAEEKKHHLKWLEN